MHQWEVYTSGRVRRLWKNTGRSKKDIPHAGGEVPILERSGRGARLSEALTRGLITKKSLNPAEVSCFAKEKSALKRIKYVPESEVSPGAPY